jgi:hypothetical protein
VPRQFDDPPPVVLPWPQWYAMKGRAPEAGGVGQGMHVLFVGPTQSGKTLLCRVMARRRNPVVVFGTKPVDPSLDEYVAEGYVRIDHWPPTPRDYREGRKVWADGDCRFILWPHMKSRKDLRGFSHIYEKALDEIFIEGFWCIVVDEGLWLASPSGLGLALPLGDTAYGTASNNVSLYLLIQRPAGVPPVTWTSVSEAEIFSMGNREDVRKLASLGRQEPNQTIQVVRKLQGHQFLSLPTRGQADWTISELDLAQI